MPVALYSPGDRLLSEVAESYIRKGYPVTIKPLEEDLPEFLREFRPDLLVITPEEKVVVEVKGSDKLRPEDFFERLEKAVQAHPGWSYRFVLHNVREKELKEALLPALGFDEIRERLDAGEQLASSGLLDSALVVIWSAVEGTLRQMAADEKLTIPNQGPGALITILYSEGSLSREDYDVLKRLLEIRNRAAHGFQVSDITPETVATARKIATRLLNKLNRKISRRKKAA
jgi:hypothetical protein